MSVFVDTGMFFAYHDTDADRHDQAVSAFDDLFDGESGQPYVNDYVLDETATLACARTDPFEAADTIAGRILGGEPFPNVFRMIHVKPDDVRASLETLRQYEDHDLSFTDATIVALRESCGIDTVLSLNTDFDGLVDRIEPDHWSV